MSCTAGTGLDECQVKVPGADSACHTGAHCTVSGSLFGWLKHKQDAAERSNCKQTGHGAAAGVLPSEGLPHYRATPTQDAQG